VGLVPGVAAVRAFENAAASQNKTSLPGGKVNVVNGSINTQWSLNPAATPIFGVSQKAGIARNPTAF
jgi:hypothetical protein